MREEAEEGERDYVGPGTDGASAPIRVFVVDDHSVVRRGIRAYFDLLDDIEVVGEAVNGAEALKAIQDLESGPGLPDVVLMDLVMPEMDGIAAMACLKERHPAVPVVALTSFVEPERVQEALRAGAEGYVLKNADADAIAHAVRAAHRGETHLDPVAARQLAQALHAPKPVRIASLTTREEEVLRLLARGMSNRQIARALIVSERTARSHVSSILSKLGLPSRTQAAVWAIQEGLGERASG